MQMNDAFMNANVPGRFDYNFACVYVFVVCVCIYMLWCPCNILFLHQSILCNCNLKKILVHSLVSTDESHTGLVQHYDINDMHNDKKYFFFFG